MTRPLKVVQMYPRHMNIYGDWGNTLVISQRLKWAGFDVDLVDYNLGDDFPTDADLLLGGGGQDSGQTVIGQDLLALTPTLTQMANDDVPMLMICGMYQLFGHAFHTRTGETLPGTRILDMETTGGDERLIGNVVTSSPDFGEIIGYENHSGLTTLSAGTTPLGRVLKGHGNNGSDGTEGARYRHVLGTYLHGSLLPKNPAIADWLISQAVRRAGGQFEAGQIDDTLAERARESAKSRPQ